MATHEIKTLRMPYEIHGSLRGGFTVREQQSQFEVPSITAAFSTADEMIDWLRACHAEALTPTERETV